MNTTFVCEGRENDDDHGWKDYALTDTSPNGIRRLWVLSVSTEGLDSYSTLRRSKTDDGEFDHDVVLPKKMTDHLMGIVSEWTDSQPQRSA